jgi:hypothetical protein
LTQQDARAGELVRRPDLPPLLRLIAQWGYATPRSKSAVNRKIRMGQAACKPVSLTLRLVQYPAKGRCIQRARENHFDSAEHRWPARWNRPGLSGYLVCLVHLMSLMQPNKPDRPNRPTEQDRLADFFSILLSDRCLEGGECIGQLPGRLNSRGFPKTVTSPAMPRMQPQPCRA